MMGSDAVDAEIMFLRKNYSDFPVEEETYEVSDDSFERVRDLYNSGVHGAARVRVQRGDETLLVRENSRPDSWGVAGGLVEPDEHSDDAGHREFGEETGIECAIDDVAYVQLAAYRSDNASEPILQYAVAFVATYIGGAIDKQEAEIAEVGWFEEPPESIHPPATRIGSERLGWTLTD
jgi:ADP-ribose pyrophosphatase YjhB (NUDIX family)